MQYRNAQHISGGRIDCEIESPIWGWIPYTLDPADTDMTVDNGALLEAMVAADDVAPQAILAIASPQETEGGV